MDKNPPTNAGDMGSTPSQEGSMCRGATKPICHNYWGLHTPRPEGHNQRAPVLQLPKPKCLEPVYSNQRKPAQNNKDPAQPKINKWLKNRIKYWVWGEEKGEEERHWWKGLRWVNSGDLKYSMMTIVNNKVLHTWNLLRMWSIPYF